MDASYDVVVGLGAPLDAVSGITKLSRIFERGLGDGERWGRWILDVGSC